MTYIITSATSFLGIELTKALINQGHQVTAICRHGSYGLKNLPSDVRVVYAEMNEYGALDKKIDNADVFIHLAWAGTGHDGRDDEEVQQAIVKTLATDGPVICEVHMHPEQTLFPKSASFMDKQTGKMTSAPLEKMAPFMSEELQEKCVYKA